MSELWKRVRSLDSDGVFGGDKVVWMLLFFLSIVSVIEVYSASSNMTYKTGEFWAPAMEHMKHIATGWIVAILICRIPCSYFKLFPVFFLPVAVVLLLYTMLFGEKVNGAGRWIFGFQPSELAKGLLVICIALILSITFKPETGRVTKRGFKMCILITSVICALILPENLSTALLTFIVVLMLMFVGRADWRWLGGIVGAIIFSGGMAYAFMNTASSETLQSMSNIPGLHRLPTWANRIRTTNAGEQDPDSIDILKNQQVVHAQIAVATSNIIGKGPGNSVERDYLPQAYADFIFAIIVEELGLVGGAFVVMLYLVLLFRAGVIASRCERRFPALLCMGLALLIVVQAMINVCVCVFAGTLPVTGQQLPLVSRGGSGILLNCFYIGMILSISRNAKKTDEKQDLEAIPYESNN